TSSLCAIISKLLEIDNMCKKLLIYFYFFIIPISISSETVNDYENNQLLYVKFDNMRLRTDPNDKSQTIDFLPLGEPVTFSGEISNETFKTKIQGKELTNNWIKIKTIFNEEGWIFGAAIQKEYINRKINIIQLGSYHDDEAKMNSNTNFYGISEENGKNLIKKDKIFVRSIRDSIVDKNNEKSGRELYSKNKTAKYFFLFRGIDVNENEEISGLKKGKFGIIADTLNLEDKTGRKYILSTSHSPKYRLNIQIDKQAITLFKHDANKEKIPYLHWAGDLNGDGILDFFIDDSDHTNVSSMTLYTSKVYKGKITFTVLGRIRSVGC
ncbi:SH3 domain-containing protein, partial [Leptospira terpstrae]|uniref:SH3 domain-containing protein n=1 Tax=Leptospira terpstrae TaxID=293075 RepID=UPI003CFBEAEA